MSLELQEGRILQERFALRGALHVDARSQLWTARDTRLETPVLLRLYPCHTDEGERAVRDAIQRDTLRHRSLHHPAMARVCDLHEDEDLVFVSIAPAEGELLATRLARTGPLPHREVVEKIRPIVEGLRHLHERGGEHGRVDLEHVLVHEEQWILLPADATRPAWSDMKQLGRLLASLLTGAREPQGGRELNDVAERLHAGRTIPSLLNQLVADLGIDDTHRRPAGMHDVLHRLDQLDDYLAAGASAPVLAAEVAPASIEPTTPTPIPIPPPTVSAGRRPLAPWIAVALVPAAIIGGVLLYGQTRPGDETPVATPKPAPEVTPRPSPPVVGPGEAPAIDVPAPEAPAEAAARAAAKTAADEALAQLLLERRGADEIGAGAWAGEPYVQADVLARDADAAYLEERYDAAAQRYTEAAQAFRFVVGARDEALERLLRAGGEALIAGDVEAVRESFEQALLIDPGNDEATGGLERAATLGRLRSLLASGRAHEDAGRLALAHVDFASAVALDRQSPEAAADLARVKQRMADEQFNMLMAQGMEAYHAGDYATARARLMKAKEFRPASPDAVTALEMVAEARVRAEVERLRVVGQTLEGEERWQDAWNAYRQVLAIDSAIEFAQDGRARCEETIKLLQHAQHFLENPDLLIKPGSRDEAARLVPELERARHRGAGLQRAHRALAEQVRLASIPQVVELVSDGRTEVSIHRVGRFGTFEARQLELRPGYYTVVGHRTGYKDVRLTLHLRPGAMGTTLHVACTESIR